MFVCHFSTKLQNWVGWEEEKSKKKFGLPNIYLSTYPITQFGQVVAALLTTDCFMCAVVQNHQAYKGRVSLKTAIFFSRKEMELQRMLKQGIF